jgi:hypothetical protein
MSKICDTSVHFCVVLDCPCFTQSSSILFYFGHLLHITAYQGRLVTVRSSGRCFAGKYLCFFLQGALGYLRTVHRLSYETGLNACPLGREGDFAVIDCTYFLYISPPSPKKALYFCMPNFQFFL